MTRLGKAIFLSLTALSCIPAAQAQPRREPVREHERVPFHTDHWVYDDRFHHNRYYPTVGYRLGALPPGNIAITFRGGAFWFHSGVWYQRTGAAYVVVRAPLGVVVPVLPVGYSVVYYSGVPYYYADDTYYVQQPTGYEVVAPPEAPAVAQAPAAAAPTQAPGGVWYYCDSSKTYYPYAQTCPEGWKTVPAAPPPGAPR